MAGLANACCAKVRRYESSRASWHKCCLQAPCRNGHAGTCGWGCGVRSWPCGSRGHGQGFPTATTCLRFLCAVCSFHLCSLGLLSYAGSGWDSRYAAKPLCCACTKHLLPPFSAKGAAASRAWHGCCVPGAGAPRVLQGTSLPCSPGARIRPSLSSPARLSRGAV